MNYSHAIHKQILFTKELLKRNSIYFNNIKKPFNLYIYFLIKNLIYFSKTTPFILRFHFEKIITNIMFNKKLTFKNKTSKNKKCIKKRENISEIDFLQKNNSKFSHLFILKKTQKKSVQIEKNIQIKKLSTTSIKKRSSKTREIQKNLKMKITDRRATFEKKKTMINPSFSPNAEESEEKKYVEKKKKRLSEKNVKKKKSEKKPIADPSKDKKKKKKKTREEFKKMKLIQRKMKLKNLSTKTAKKLTIEIAKKLNLSKKSKTIKMKFNDEKIVVETTIQYFHFYFKFMIFFETKSGFQLKSSSKRSSKSTINIKYNKIFAKMTKNIAFNKIFEKFKQGKITVELQCFLQLLNKKGKKDWTIHDKNKQKTSKFHYIDSHESKIFENHIGFTQNMINEKMKKKDCSKCIENA